MGFLGLQIALGKYELKQTFILGVIGGVFLWTFFSTPVGVGYQSLIFHLTPIHQLASTTQFWSQFKTPFTLS